MLDSGPNSAWTKLNWTRLQPHVFQLFQSAVAKEVKTGNVVLNIVWCFLEVHTAKKQ